VVVKKDSLHLKSVKTVRIYLGACQKLKSVLYGRNVTYIELYGTYSSLASRGDQIWLIEKSETFFKKHLARRQMLRLYSVKVRSLNVVEDEWWSEVVFHEAHFHIRHRDSPYMPHIESVRRDQTEHFGFGVTGYVFGRVGGSLFPR